MSHEVYLGDGVYVEIEHGMVKLTTRDGNIKPRDTIWLEPTVAAALVDYISEKICIEIDEPGEFLPPVRFNRLLTDEEMEALRGPNDKGLEFDFDEIKKKE